MSQKIYKLVGIHLVTDNNLRRLTLSEFHDLLRPHIDAVQTAKSILRTLSHPFISGDRVSPHDCEDTLGHLATIFHYFQNFLLLIESSASLPLAVVPLRLTLITALLDAKGQITKLNSLISTFSVDSCTALNQPTKVLQEIEQEIEVLQRQNEEIVDQGRILLDRAHFKDREYSLTKTCNQA